MGKKLWRHISFSFTCFCSYKKSTNNNKICPLPSSACLQQYFHDWFSVPTTPDKNWGKKPKISPSPNYQFCSRLCSARRLRVATLKLGSFFFFFFFFFFSELGSVMQKNSVFTKIFCPGLSENFRDLVIILSKKVRKLYQSFSFPFEH